MKTDFKPGRDWAYWVPDRAALSALLDVVDSVWEEPSNFDLTIARPDRSDTAENAAEARQLLHTDGAVASSTSMTLTVIGIDASPRALFFQWSGSSARLSVAGTDEITARALRDRAAEILDAAASDGPSREPTPSRFAQSVVEHESKLALARVRYSGTYDELHQLICDLAEQVRVVRGDVDRVYLSLSERSGSVTVRHLGELGSITGRDIDHLRHLTIALGSSVDGPSLSLYIHSWRLMGAMHGDVTGPEEAPVRALRAAANELLRDRSRSPQWLRQWMLYSAIVLLEAVALSISIAGNSWWAVVALTGVALAVSAFPLYWPELELLRPGETTRWSRWSRAIVGLAIAWVIGSLAVPLLN